MRKTTIQLKKCVVLAMLLLASVLTAAAADFMEENLYFNIIGDNEVEVAQWETDKYVGDVVIPATVVHDGITYQVTRIGEKAFYLCSGMSMIDIPEGVTSIGEMAFYCCEMLTAIDFPNSLTTIERRAFYGCYGLTGFYITRNVSFIHEEAFHHCIYVTSYLCNSMNAHYKSVNGILYSKDLSTIVAYPPSAPATTFDIPETVTRIGGLAFFMNQNLVNINIPESVTWVGTAAFASSAKLASIYFPDAVTYMGKSVCFSCDSLRDVRISANVDTIHDQSFGWCNSLKELTIPRSVTYIGESNFYNSAIQTVNFEEGSRLKAIGERTFEMCKSLEYFDMPDSVTSFGYQLFAYCWNLKRVHLSESLTELPSTTFLRNNYLTEIEIPASVTLVKGSSIDDCASLTRVKIGDRNAMPGTTTVGSSVLWDCLAVERLELGANVDSIGRWAFDDPECIKVVISWAAVPPRAGYGMVSNATYQNGVLYVPKASLEAYQTVEQWKKFKTIVPIDDLGDVNINGMIDIVDVTTLIDQLLAGEIANPAYADVDLNGTIDIVDVTALIDLLLNN